MPSILLLGFLVGMRHALEADHLAAVASLATAGGARRGATVLRGAVWGVGHTVALLVVGGACLALRLNIPPRLGRLLELGVGVMLLGLGAEIVRRWHRQRVHIHRHRHGDGVVHVHAHSHAPDEPHDPARHAHAHPAWHGAGHGRALGVGLVHGIAGSGALVLLTVQTLGSIWLGLGYILLFGAGSIAGMALLSAMIAVPLERSARRLGRVHSGLELAISAGTIAIGLWVIVRSI